MNQALLIIDLQNDYFPGGALPLWNAEAVLDTLLAAIARAQALGMPVVLVQHVADASRGPAPFFNAGTKGVELHPRLRAAAPQAPVVVKAFADAFQWTGLEETLRGLGATRLLVAGMMTQNCVTHTAISRTADHFDITVLADGCTTVSELMHRIALNALSTRVALAETAQAL